jgi:hypothetical protein
MQGNCDSTPISLHGSHILDVYRRNSFISQSCQSFHEVERQEILLYFWLGLVYHYEFIFKFSFFMRDMFYHNFSRSSFHGVYFCVVEVWWFWQWESVRIMKLAYFAPSIVIGCHLSYWFFSKFIVFSMFRCWLSTEKGLIWAFVAPVLGVVLVCTLSQLRLNRYSCDFVTT